MRSILDLIKRNEIFYKGLCIKKLVNNFHPRYIVYDLLAKTLLQQGRSESVFCGDLNNKFKRIIVKPNFSTIQKDI